MVIDADDDGIIERGEEITAVFEGQEKARLEIPADAVCAQCGKTLREHTSDDHRACAKKQQGKG